MSEILLMAKGLRSSGKTHVLMKIKAFLEQEGYEVNYPPESSENTRGPIETMTIRSLRADTPIGNEVGRAGEGKPTDEPIHPGSEVRPLESTTKGEGNE